MSHISITLQESTVACINQTWVDGCTTGRWFRFNSGRATSKPFTSWFCILSLIRFYSESVFVAFVSWFYVSKKMWALTWYHYSNPCCVLCVECRGIELPQEYVVCWSVCNWGQDTRNRAWSLDHSLPKLLIAWCALGLIGQVVSIVSLVHWYLLGGGHTDLLIISQNSDSIFDSGHKCFSR